MIRIYSAKNVNLRKFDDVAQFDFEPYCRMQSRFGVPFHFAGILRSEWNVLNSRATLMHLYLHCGRKSMNGLAHNRRIYSGKISSGIASIVSVETADLCNIYTVTIST